jgi:hypothetical protein
MSGPGETLGSPSPVAIGHPFPYAHVAIAHNRFDMEYILIHGLQTMSRRESFSDLKKEDPMDFSDIHFQGCIARGDVLQGRIARSILGLPNIRNFSCHSLRLVIGCS